MAGPILLFDVMDTLVHDPFHDEVLAFFSMSLDELFAVKDKQAWIRFECGHSDEATLAAEYFTDRRPLDLDGLKSTMRHAYRWLEGAEALLADLQSAGYRMHALSNYPTWWEMIEARLHLSAYLEWSFVSCRTGVRKPDPQAYLGPARTLGVRPEDCLFIDDREKNCAAARAVGMPSIRFEDVGQLRAALRACGVG